MLRRFMVQRYGVRKIATPGCYAELFFQSQMRIAVAFGLLLEAGLYEIPRPKLGPFLAPLQIKFLAVPVAGLVGAKAVAVDLAQGQENMRVIVPLVAVGVRGMDRHIGNHADRKSVV